MTASQNRSITSVTCIHTFIHTSIHTYIHTYILSTRPSIHPLLVPFHPSRPSHPHLVPIPSIYLSIHPIYPLSAHVLHIWPSSLPFISALLSNILSPYLRPPSLNRSRCRSVAPILPPLHLLPLTHPLITHILSPYPLPRSIGSFVGV